MVRTPEASLISYLDSNLCFEEEVPPLKADDIVRVSAFSGLCPRAEVICGLHNIVRRNEVNADLNLIFAAGHGLHHILQNRILTMVDVLYGQWSCLGCAKIYGDYKDIPKLIVTKPKTCTACGGKDFHYREGHFEDHKLKLSGHPDGFIKLPTRPDFGILEFKTISPRGAWEIKNCPKMDHVVQAQIYLWLTGLQWSLIVYWDKGTVGLNGLVEHFVERDEDTLANVQEELTKIRVGIREGKLPERICEGPACPRAKTCSVSKQCFEVAA